jgi:hypothetical protein
MITGLVWLYNNLKKDIRQSSSPGFMLRYVFRGLVGGFRRGY